MPIGSWSRPNTLMLYFNGYDWMGTLSGIAQERVGIDRLRGTSYLEGAIRTFFGCHRRSTCAVLTCVIQSVMHLGRPSYFPSRA